MHRCHPIIIGIVVGFPTGVLLGKSKNRYVSLTVLLCGITITMLSGWLINTYLLSGITLNYMLMGVSFSAVFSNMVTSEQLADINHDFAPILGVSLVFTGIICTTLASAPELVQIVQGTIAAAAVINEFIAVIAAKKGFELAGEIK